MGLSGLLFSVLLEICYIVTKNLAKNKTYNSLLLFGLLKLPHGLWCVLIFFCGTLEN